MELLGFRDVLCAEQRVRFPRRGPNPMAGALTPETLYDALRSPCGIILAVSDLERARQRLYAIKRELNDPDLESLAFVQSPTSPTELWIVKKDSKNVS